MSEAEGDFDWGTLTTGDAAPAEGSPAEPEAAQEEAVTEAATTTEDDGRARDPETGRFLPKDQKDPRVQAVLDKYGDPEKALLALAESQSYIGQLHQTQGELQAQLAELTQAIRTPRPQQNFETLLETDPQQAAMYALQTGDRAAYERAKSEWNDLAPGAPAIWEQNLQLQNKMAELEQRVQGVQQPIAEQQNLRVVATAYQQVQASNPDFDSLQPMMSQIVGEIAESGYDWISPALDSGDPRAATVALSQLVELARARAGGNLQDQARQAAQEHVAATEQAKREAIVASASSTMSESNNTSPGQAVADQWGKFDISALRHS